MIKHVSSTLQALFHTILKIMLLRYVQLFLFSGLGIEPLLYSFLTMLREHQRGSKKHWTSFLTTVGINLRCLSHCALWGNLNHSHFPAEETYTEDIAVQLEKQRIDSNIFEELPNRDKQQFANCIVRSLNISKYK